MTLSCGAIEQTQQRLHTVVANGELQSLRVHICSWSSLRCELGTIRASHVTAGTLSLLQGRRHPSPGRQFG